MVSAIPAVGRMRRLSDISSGLSHENRVMRRRVVAHGTRIAKERSVHSTEAAELHSVHPTQRTVHPTEADGWED